jgi:hypothetical protein
MSLSTLEPGGMSLSTLEDRRDVPLHLGAQEGNSTPPWNTGETSLPHSLEYRYVPMHPKEIMELQVIFKD